MSRLILHIGMPKTGTSSIQETLYTWGGLGEIRYADLGMANHGGVISSFFSENPYSWRGHRVAGRSQKEVDQFNKQVFFKLDTICSSQGTQLISGEGIWHMSEPALIKLRDYFAPYFGCIEVIGYVRPPASFITSAFQQLVKNHGLTQLNAEANYPNYQNKFEKFDRVFGRDNVTLRLFDPKQLVGGDAVVDFCQLLGESISPEQVQRVNESLSLEATAVLFAYRREGPKYAPYRGKARDNNALVESLVSFGSRKLRFSESLIAPVLEKHRDDIAWMEQRLGQSIIDQGSKDTEAISSEAQLLEIAVEQFDALEAYVDKQLSETKQTPKQVARWVEKLRTATAGRNFYESVPVYGSQGFFTEEQMARLEDTALTPVIALRELALAFERNGLIEEARSVIQSAIVLRPDAKGLLALQQRLNVGFDVKVSKSIDRSKLERRKNNKLTRKFLGPLSSSSREETMYKALQEGLQGASFRFFFNLRRFYPNIWEPVVLRFHEDNPSNAQCMLLLVFHYGRKKSLKESNFYLKKIFEVQSDKAVDIVRQFFRNQIVAGVVKEGLSEECIDWNTVEPFFKNKLSTSSYLFQACVATNKGGYVKVGDCHKEWNEFRGEVEKARVLLERTGDISARNDWAVALKMVKNARTIAVVGKGNSLKGCGLGSIIDSHDLVLRVNHASSHDSADDFGEKTSVIFYGRHLKNKFHGSNHTQEPHAVMLSGFPKYIERKESVQIPDEYRLEYFIDSIGYKRATTGLRLLIALPLFIELRDDAEIHAFGFDFYTCPVPGEGTVDEVRNSAGVSHEIDYEKWLAHEFLPLFTTLRHTTTGSVETFS
jgi:hypothetical protein